MIKSNLIKKVFFLSAAGCFTAPFLVVLCNILAEISLHPTQLFYFVSSSFLKKLGNSFLLSSTVACTGVVVGLLLTYLYYSLRVLWQRVTMLLGLMILVSISPVVYLAAFIRYDFFNSFPVFCQAVLVLTLSTSPIAFAVLVLAVGNISKTSLDTAFASAHPFFVYRQIIIPQLLAPLCGSGLILFFLVFTQQEVPSFLGLRTYAEEFLSRIIVMADPRGASLFALPFLVVGFLAMPLLLYLSSRFRLYSLANDRNQSLPFTVRASKIINLFGVLMLALFLSFIAAIFQNLPTENLFNVFVENLKAMAVSSLIALVSAFAGTLIGYFLYNNFTDTKKRAALTLMATVLVAYWLIPPSLTGLGLITIGRFLGIHTELCDIFILLLGYQTKLLPLALFTLAAIQINSQKSDDIVARLVKFPAIRTFTKLVLPLQWPKWLMTATILAIFALNELSLTVLLVPPGIETLVIRIYNLMHYGDYGLVAFLSLAQIALVSVIALFLAGAMKFYDKA